VALVRGERGLEHGLEEPEVRGGRVDAELARHVWRVAASRLEPQAVDDVLRRRRARSRLAVGDGDRDLRAVGEAGNADVELRRTVRVERRADALLVRLARERTAVVRLERRLVV